MGGPIQNLPMHGQNIPLWSYYKSLVLNCLVWKYNMHPMDAQLLDTRSLYAYNIVLLTVVYISVS